LWVKGPVGYGQHWARIAGAFRDFEEDPRFHVFRHEEITGDSGFADRLGTLLDMRLSPRAWATRVSETPKTRPDLLERAELSVLVRACRREAALWGYEI
jgi:hypothetical protein